LRKASGFDPSGAAAVRSNCSSGTPGGRPWSAKAGAASELLKAERKLRKVKGFQELEELGRILDPELHSKVRVA